MSLFRRSRPPEEVRGLPLEPGERLLVWARAEGGGWLTASTYGLWNGRERTRWDEVDKATWRDDRLVVVSSGNQPAHERTRAWRLEEPGDLPEVVRTRVTASVAYSSHSRLAGRRSGVRVVARRRPGVDGLVWSVVYDVAADRDDPLVRAEAEQLLAAAQETVGGPPAPGDGLL